MTADMGTTPAKIAVIILTVNQRENTVRCLESLRAVKSPPHRIVLWDNGSTDGTTEYIRENFPDVLVHRHPTNLGVASGRNAVAKLAIEELQPTHLLILDNDTVVTPSFLEALLEPFGRDPKIAQTAPKIRSIGDDRRLFAAGGSKVRFWTGSTQTIGYGEIDRGQYDAPGRCIASGCCSLVRRDVFELMGGFDPVFDPYGPEDLDFALRVLQHGFETLYVPHSLIFHDISQTFESGKYTQRYATHKARNWVLFMRRHAPPVQQLAFFLIGAPFVFARALVRGVRGGNYLASLALLRGGIASWRSR